MPDRHVEPLPSLRDCFVLPSRVAYLNCANMAAQLRTVGRAGIRAVQRLRAPWEIRAEDWFSGAEALRAAAAGLMGADADGVALVPSVSYGIATAAANLRLRRGQNVVLLDQQYPSNVYAWRDRVRRCRATTRTVQRAAPESWTDAVLGAIDQDTAVVAVPNCHWTDGALVDLQAVGQAARAVGAALVVDASQSFGAYPLDVAVIQPDFVTSVGYKWQLGPYGLGYLYVAPTWRDVGRPLEASWLTREGAENFTNLVHYTDRYRPGARRFDMGQYPQFVLVPMALAALAQVASWTVSRVAVTLAVLTKLIGTEAESMGCQVLPPGKRVGHMIGIRPPRGIPGTLHERLVEQQVYVSLRGDVIRVAPHVYNGEADARRFLAVLRQCL